VCGLPTPDGPLTFRNHTDKTKLGRWIDSPLKFLDSDTVVRKPLAPLLVLATMGSLDPRKAQKMQGFFDPQAF
jgi:hypothetical protein